MRDFIKVMKALSDSNRIKMIKLLQRRVLCVCEIQKAMGSAQFTAGKHLKILEHAGLITYSREGLWVNYRLADGDRNPYVASLFGNLRHWLEDDPEVGNWFPGCPKSAVKSFAPVNFFLAFLYHHMAK